MRDENDDLVGGAFPDDPGVHYLRPQDAMVREREVLPHEARAERALVGAILACNGDCYEDVIRVAPASTFYDSGWRVVLDAVGALREANLPCDGASVVEYLMARRVDDGGPPLVERVVWAGERGPLAVLNAAADAPVAVTVMGYARKVAEVAVRRQAILDTRRITALLSSPSTSTEDVRRAMEEAAERMRTIESSKPEWRHIGEVAQDVVDVMGAAMSGRPTSVFPTGYAGLDAAFGGGLVPGDVLVIGGRPGHGKSAFVTSMSIRSARKGVGVAIFSLELMESVVARRVLAQQSRINTSALKGGVHANGRQLSTPEIQDVVDGVHALGELPIWINDRTAQTVASVRSGIRKVRGRCPELGIVVVDYLQIMAFSGNKNASLANTLADAAQSIRNMAKEERVAIVLLSQLGRDIEKRADAKPRMSDLRDSGGIEAAATRILFPWRESMLNPSDPSLKDKATFILVKNTDGEANLEIPVRWFGEYQEFADEEVAFSYRPGTERRRAGSDDGPLY